MASAWAFRTEATLGGFPSYGGGPAAPVATARRRVSPRRNRCTRPPRRLCTTSSSAATTRWPVNSTIVGSELTLCAPDLSSDAGTRTAGSPEPAVQPLQLLEGLLLVGVVEQEQLGGTTRRPSSIRPKGWACTLVVSPRAAMRRWHSGAVCADSQWSSALGPPVRSTRYGGRLHRRVRVVFAAAAGRGSVRTRVFP
jgi:hypothetical protein